MNVRLLCACLLLAAPGGFAQNAPAPAQAAPPAPIQRHFDQQQRGDGHGMPGGEMRGPREHMMPEGTWWRNPEVASRIGLTPDQVKRIDEIFLQSRVQLIHMHASLEEEQLLLEPLMDANPVDQAKALAQIGKIADTRAELEKTDAKMLLSIRAVLNADQWTKLQDRHHGERRPEMGGQDGQRGPRGPMGRGPGQSGPPPQPE
jgi:Spy/CpxP family protein refolding chaperone